MAPTKWLLASAVHKSIRRGHAGQAHKFAADLLSTQPSYLSYRLGVIALEEVGPGDWQLVAATLDKIRARETAALPDLAARLAEAPKSRSCVYAKRLPPADTLDLDPLARFLASYGQGFEKLGAGVPHVMQLVAESEATEVVMNEPDAAGDEMIAGLPAATYDRHTSPGKFAIRQFHRQLRTQFTEEQVSYALFCVEGAYIGPRELIFDGSDALRIESIESAYRERGITSRDQMLDLTQLIRQNRGLLNEARRRVLK
jgi:hypothetical protein